MRLVAALLVAPLLVALAPVAPADGAVLAPGQQATWTDACDPACAPYTLHVEVPDGYWDGRVGGLEVAVRWATEQGDHHLTVVLPDGTQQSSAVGFFSTADSLVIPRATSGTYTVLVKTVLPDPAGIEGIVHFNAQPAPTGPSRDLLPDLVGLPPTHLGLEAPVFYATGTPLTVDEARVASCYPDETLATGATRCLRFSNGVANLGDGTLELRFFGERVEGADFSADQRVFQSDGGHRDRSAGRAVWHEMHGHFHYEGFSEYLLYHVDPVTHERLALASESRKEGFCLVDVGIARWGEVGNGPRTYAFPNCDGPTQVDARGAWMLQGITVGWFDVYTWDLPDQYVDVTGLPAGTYELVSVTNPDGLIEELDYTNNVASVLLELTADGVRVL